MATKNHNLSKFDSPLPSAADMRFGIVVAEWNREVTEALLEGAVRTLRAAGCPDMNIQVKYVPGTFELSLGAQFFAEYTESSPQAGPARSRPPALWCASA